MWGAILWGRLWIRSLARCFQFNKYYLKTRRVNGHSQSQACQSASTTGCRAPQQCCIRRQEGWGYCSTRSKGLGSVPSRATQSPFLQAVSSAVHVCVCPPRLLKTNSYLETTVSVLCVMCLDPIVTHQPWRRQSLFVNLPNSNWSHSTKHICSIIMLYTVMTAS